MKIVITSDAHFGDGLSQLAAFDPNGEPILGPKYEQFKTACGFDNDYLIMLGDIIDVAIKDYKDAYKIAKRFFQQVAEDNITKRILYVPGNHDYDLWHAVEYQANIIKRVEEKKDEENKKEISLLKMSVPAILDDRPDRTGPEIFLAHVTRQPDPQKPYGGLFLDFWVDKKLEFYVAFPNLYLITEQGESILLTHGQYFQMFWSLLSEWGPETFGEDLNIDYPPLIIKNLVHLNFPFSQFASSGVGQAGPLSEIIRDIQYDFKKHKPVKIMKYVNNLETILKRDVLKANWWKPKDWPKLIGLYLAKRSIKKWIEKRPDTSPRKDKDWEYNPDTHKKMENYYRSSNAEIESLNKEYNLNIPKDPRKLIFGHSHRPIGINELDRLNIHPLPDPSINVPVFNTGGWLEEERDGKIQFNGIEIFTYETGIGLNSIRIQD